MLYEFSNVVGKTIVDRLADEPENLKKLEERQTKLEAMVKAQQNQIEQLLNDTNNPDTDTEKQCLNYQESAKSIKKGDGSFPKGQFS